MQTRARIGSYDVRSSWQNEVFYIYFWVSDTEDYEMDETFTDLDAAKAFCKNEAARDKKLAAHRENPCSAYRQGFDCCCNG